MRESPSSPASCRGLFDPSLFEGDKHVGVHVEGLRVIEAFRIPSSWYVDRSFDWGSSKPYAVLWWAESDGTTAPNGKVYPRGTLFLIYEQYGWNGTPNEGTKRLAIDVAKGAFGREMVP